MKFKEFISFNWQKLIIFLVIGFIPFILLNTLRALKVSSQTLRGIFILKPFSLFLGYTGQLIDFLLYWILACLIFYLYKKYKSNSASAKPAP